MFSISKALLGLGLALAIAPAAWAESRSFTLTPASEVRYQGHHPAHDWAGVSRALKGGFTVTDGKQVATPFEIKIPVRSFSSGNRNRDNNALAIIEAERFPHAVLTVRSLEVVQQQTTGTTTSGRIKLSGTLTFHGVAQPLTVVMDGKLEGDRLKAAGSFPLLLSAFHVKRPALLFVPIDDTIVVTVNLDAVAN